MALVTPDLTTSSDDDDELQEEIQIGKTRLNFSNPNQRAEHVRAFLEWLPDELRQAPLIDWDAMPSRVMAYLIHNLDRTSLIAVAVTLGIGASSGAVGVASLYIMTHSVSRLLGRLQDMGSPSLLVHRAVVRPGRRYTPILALEGVTEIGLQRVEKLCRRFHGSGPLPTKLGRALISTKSDGEPGYGHVHQHQTDGR